MKKTTKIYTSLILIAGALCATFGCCSVTRSPAVFDFWGDYRSDGHGHWRLSLDKTEYFGKLTRGQEPMEDTIGRGIVVLEPDAKGSSCLVRMFIPEFDKFQQRNLKISHIGENRFEILDDVGTPEERSLGNDFTRKD